MFITKTFSFKPAPYGFKEGELEKKISEKLTELEKEVGQPPLFFDSRIEGYKDRDQGGSPKITEFHCIAIFRIPD